MDDMGIVLGSLLGGRDVNSGYVLAAPDREVRVSPQESAFVAQCLDVLREAYPNHSHRLAFVWRECDKAPDPFFAETLAGPEIFNRGDLVALVEVNADKPDLYPHRTRVVAVPRRRDSGEGDAPLDRLEWAKATAEQKLPKTLDAFREYTSRLGQAKVDRPERWYGVTKQVSTTDDAVAGNPSGCLLGMHWLEHGGAEEFAVQSAEIAAGMGLSVTVATTFPGHIDYLQRLLDAGVVVRPVGSVLLPHERNGWTDFAVGQRPGVVLIHHSPLLYKALPEWRMTHPDVWVMDSTHIIEHKSGGYVHDSIRYDPFIDVHHVISPELRDFLEFRGGIDPGSIAYHPLTDGSMDFMQRSVGTDEIRSRGLRVGFLGRFVRQKRPQLFVRTAARTARMCKRAGLPAPSFVMQGDGPLRTVVEQAVAKNSRTVAIELRSWGQKARFFDDIDVLLISSENEGLTLTSMEAVAHGVPVLSADVGSQISITGRAGLVPRPPGTFEQLAARRLLRHTRDPNTLDQLLENQRLLATDLLRQEPAGAFLGRTLMEIAK